MHISPNTSNTRAFSLVELSIVLVILGLLTGGILAGQSLIRAAEIRSITTQFNQFIAATQTFRDKYMAYPGDMNNATRFWNRQVNAATCATNSAATVTTPGTCDGNNNGMIDLPTGSNERFQYWRQLALSGLIEGTYSGVAEGANSYSALVGTNTPTGRISNTGWYAANGAYASHAFWFDNDYGNYMTFGLQTADNHPSRALTSEEAWNIDVKMDDGRPGMGKVWGNNWNQCTTATTFTAAQAAAANYDFTVTGRNCAPVFVKLF